MNGRRLHSLKVPDMTILNVDPANCRPFAGNARNADRLTAESCRDLIESIRSEGGQHIPAIVRPLGKGRWHYQIICGARRHFAISHLRQSGLDLPFVVDVRMLSDAEAFRLTDLENRNRADVSDYERACSYAHALADYYGGSQMDMAAALDVSRSWLSRYLQIARLPKPIVAAFRSPDDIRAGHARRIRRLLADETKRDAVIRTAHTLQRHAPDLGATEVLRHLEAVACPEQEAKRAAKVRKFRNSPFCPYVTLRKSGDRAVVEFPADITRSALRGALEQMLEQAAWKR